MTISECVLDAELFRKSSSDIIYDNMEQFLQHKINEKEFNIDDINECNCFWDFLVSVENHKCKIGLDQEKRILLKYIEFIRKCPKDIQTKFAVINSQRECFNHTIDAMKGEDKDRFIKKNFHSKIHYIITACSLNPRTIVSTKKDIEENYNLCQDELCFVQINCVNPCIIKHQILFS